MSGRYIWTETTEYIEGVPVKHLDPEYRPDEEPQCPKCEDYGEWVDEDGNVEPCPKCGGGQRPGR